MSNTDILSRRRMRRLLSEPSDLPRTLDAATYTAARRYMLATETPVPTASTSQNRLPMPDMYVVDGIDVRPDEADCPPDYPMCSDTQTRGNRMFLRAEGLGEFAVDRRTRLSPPAFSFHADLRRKTRCGEQCSAEPQ